MRIQELKRIDIPENIKMNVVSFSSVQFWFPLFAPINMSIGDTKAIMGVTITNVFLAHSLYFNIEKPATNIMALEIVETIFPPKIISGGI